MTGQIITSHDDKLSVALEVPDFAVDLLRELQAAIKSFEAHGSGASFQDSLSDDRIILHFNPLASRWLFLIAKFNLDGSILGWRSGQERG